MPLHIDIKVNEQLIDQLHIGRLDQLYSNEQVSQYLVVRGIYPPHAVPYQQEGVSFMHKYDDGALVCVEKAIAALRGVGNTNERGGR